MVGPNSLSSLVERAQRAHSAVPLRASGQLSDPRQSQFLEWLYRRRSAHSDGLPPGATCSLIPVPASLPQNGTAPSNSHPNPARDAPLYLSTADARTAGAPDSIS